jgi:hypothetical protein
MQRQGLSQQFLSDIVMAEVHKLDNESLTFRGNSIATKAMEAFMKLVGEKYLQDTLGDFVRTILEMADDCEVDPSRVANNNTLHKQQCNLIMYAEMAWFKIINSFTSFPSELHDVFASLSERCAECKRGEVSEHLISACIFLRFLCPAVLSPSLFNLIQEFPQDRAARNLTLIAKTLQNLANFTKFGGKEEYMTFMNDFVEREFDSMHTYIHRISSAEGGKGTPFDGYVDLGKELSVLHTLLVESVEKMNDSSQSKLTPLKQILEELTEAELSPEGLLRNRQLAASPMIYDNVMTSSQENINTNFMPVNGANTTTVAAAGRAQYTDANLSQTRDTCVETYYGTVSRFRPAPDVSTANFTSHYGTRLRQRVTPDLSPTHAEPPYGLMSSHRRPSGNESRPHTTQRAPPLGSAQYSQQRAASEQSATDDYVMFSSPNDDPARFRTSPSHVSSTAHHPRPNEHEVNQSWNRIVSAAELVNGDHVDLVSFVDEDGANSSMDLDTGSQVSTVASSGYQSFGYSQCSSPIDCGAQDVMVPSAQPLSFSNPLFNHPADVNTQAPAPPVGVTRVLSSSSLSSEDGSLSSPTHKSSSHRKRNPRTGEIHEHTQRKLSNLSLSSSSSDSVKDSGKGFSPSHSYPRSATTGHQRSSPPHSHPGTSYRNGQHQGGATSQLVHSHSVSGYTNLSSPLTENRPLTINKLSKSAEFSAFQHPSPSPLGMKRTITDSMISHTAAGSRAPYIGSTRSPLPLQHVGRVPFTQPAQQPEPERSNLEYEEELGLLREQLAQTQNMLQETQTRLLTAKSEPDWQEPVKHGRELHRHQSHPPTTAGRLIAEEEQVKKGQMHNVVDQKQKVIVAQERRIQSLDAANARLLSALNQLKDRYHGAPGYNGINNTSKPPKLALADNGQFKSSSC